MTNVQFGSARTTRPPPARSASRTAQRITGRDYLSHTQISTMRACPAKFRFAYVDHAPADHITSSLAFGGAIHTAIELHYRCRMEGLTATAEALFSAYRDAWRRQIREAGEHVPIRFCKGEDENVLDDLAGRIIAAFLASPVAAVNGTVLGVEEELRVVLDPELPDVLAKVDLVVQHTDSLKVIDFKTSRSRWSEDKATESAEQLTLYGTTVARMSNDLSLPVSLHFAVLTKAKNPIVQMIDVAADDARVHQMKQNVAGVWQAITAGNFYPSPSPQTCCTCPFKSRCPVFAGR